MARKTAAKAAAINGELDQAVRDLEADDPFDLELQRIDSVEGVDALIRQLRETFEKQVKALENKRVKLAFDADPVAYIAKMREQVRAELMAELAPKGDDSEGEGFALTPSPGPKAAKPKKSPQGAKKGASKGGAFTPLDLYQAAKDNPGVGRSKLAEVLGVDAEKLSAPLARLVEGKHLTKTGERRSTVYTATKNAP